MLALGEEAQKLTDQATECIVNAKGFNLGCYPEVTEKLREVNQQRDRLNKEAFAKASACHQENKTAYEARQRVQDNEGRVSKARRARSHRVCASAIMGQGDRVADSISRGTQIF